MKLDLQNKPELRRKRIELQRWLSIIDIALTESPVTGMGKRPGSSIPSILEPILEKLEDRFNASEAYALVEKPRRQAIKLALREASEAGAIEILQLGKGRRPTVFRKVLVE